VCGAAAPADLHAASGETFDDRLTAALSDRYRVEQELGQGGMAVVYLAHDVKHDRDVALKVMRPELAAALGDTGTKRFLREIQILARLNHPHILPVHDSGEANGVLYYVMPYIEGESLRTRMQREGPLPIDESLRIARDIASALDYAHSLDIVHRDIKPENILLHHGQAMVADFGIAKAASAAGERLTETGLAVGTPLYMSPEQASGDPTITGQSDLYSLACVLYEMLAGEPPYTGPSIQAVLAKKLTEPVPRISAVRETVSADLEGALTRGLAKQPADRWLRAGDVAQELETLRAPREGATRPAPAADRRAPTHHRAKLVAAVITVVAGATGVALFGPWRTTDGADARRVFVAAFTDETGAAELSAIGRMAQDYVIQILTEAQVAEVVDPLTALAVTRNVVTAGVGGGDAMALAAEARAGTIVTGTYYASGDSVHIQTRITDARRNRVVSTVGPVSGTQRALPDLMVRLGQAAAGALAAVLDEDLEAFDPLTRPAALGAYEAFNEGLEAYLGGDNATAESHFQRAMAADPSFTRARLWAVQSHLLSDAPVAEQWVRLEVADSMLAPLLDGRDRLNRYERCRLEFVVAVRQWDRTALYDGARCMVDAAPGSDDAKRELALWTFWGLNRPGEAVQLLRELDPDRGLLTEWSDYWSVLGEAYYVSGAYERALEVVREERRRLPDRLNARVKEIRALTALGRLDEVETAVASLRAVSAHDRWGWWVSRAGFWIRALGHPERADSLFDEAIAWYEARVPADRESRTDFAAVLYDAKRFDAAGNVYRQLADEYPESPVYLGALGRLAARRGARDDALRISAALGSARYPPLEVGAVTVNRAKIAALLGDRDEMAALLQQVRGAFYTQWAEDVDFESVRDYQPYLEWSRPQG
jgi:tetratricopeptide (TPR) repeat protein/predicted Ser/Thr protein kinase